MGLRNVTSRRRRRSQPACVVARDGIRALQTGVCSARAAPAPPPTKAERRPLATLTHPSAAFLSSPLIRSARALPFMPHQRFRFVILIRLTERRGRWTDARALHSVTYLHPSRASTHVRSPDCNFINLSTYTLTTQHY